MIKPSRTAIEGYGGVQRPTAVIRHGKPSESLVWEENPTRRLPKLIADIATRLMQNTQGVTYGAAEVKLKIHEGVIVSVNYLQTVSVRDDVGGEA